MQVEGKVGPIEAASGSVNPLRTDQFGSLVTLQGGQYQDAAMSSRVFSYANQAAVSTRAALDTNCTGLIVGNPAGSERYLVLLQAGAAIEVDSGVTGIVGLMSGAGEIAGGTLLPRNAKRGGGASVANISETQAVIGTPVLERILATFGNEETNTWGVVPGALTNLNGSMVVCPGYFVAFFTTVAVTTAFIFSLTWEEVPIQ
jgi:hypothetical protein